MGGTERKVRIRQLDRQVSATREVEAQVADAAAHPDSINQRSEILGDAARHRGGIDAVQAGEVEHGH